MDFADKEMLEHIITQLLSNVLNIASSILLVYHLILKTVPVSFPIQIVMLMLEIFYQEWEAFTSSGKVQELQELRLFSCSK